MKMIENDIKQEKKEVLTVWFEPWKYENEKYLAIVPLLRTIRIALENTFNDNKVRQIKNGINNTLKAVLASIEFNASLGQAGMNIDFEKVIKNLKTKDHVFINNESVYYYSHVTDHLKGIVEKVNKENNNNFRIVIFIDDLDRCLPENALAILESALLT